VSLQAAILGFIALEPASGYTLKQRFDGSVRSFWTATQSQIYRELHALERQRLVAVKSVPQDGKPDRKVYSVTPDGRAALVRWLAEAPEPLALRHPLLLKFVFAADMLPGELDALLRRYEEGVSETRKEYVARIGEPKIFSLARSDRERRLWRLAVEHGLAWCDMELEWLARVRRELAPQRKETKRWTRQAK
jgi:PadR family transcriptional regulator, regulatory protein AphA